MNPDPVALVLRLVDAPAADDAAVVQWLADGFRRWLDSGGSLSLTACLHLPAKSVNLRRRARDLWLREAARHLEGSTWARARALLRESKRYRRSRWRRGGGAAMPAPGLRPVEQCIHLALRYGTDVPGTVQGIARILTEDAQAKAVGLLGEVGARCDRQQEDDQHACIRSSGSTPDGAAP